MAIYSLSVETTSNNTAGNAGADSAIQFLMPASRDAKLLAVYIKQAATAAGENSGRWVVDRISAVSGGSSLTPLKMDPGSPASAITDTTKTISTTLACAPTVVDAAIVDLMDGYNDLRPLNIRAGMNQGFAIRRATAPTGARVVDIIAIWEEV